MRKTSTLPNGEKIDYKRVAELAYLEFASGRIERKSNAEQEIRNRIGPTVPLVYPTWKHEASEAKFDKKFFEHVKRWRSVSKVVVESREMIWKTFSLAR